MKEETERPDMDSIKVINVTFNKNYGIYKT